MPVESMSGFANCLVRLFVLLLALVYSAVAAHSQEEAQLQYIQASPQDIGK
jgi:hypothetical protein